MPDVTVKTIGSSGDNDYPSYLVVEFDLKAAQADANNIEIVSTCTYRRQLDNAISRDESQPTKHMGLSATWSPPVPFLVNCVPLPGEYVSSVLLQANVPGGDANPGDNKNVWDHINGPF